MQQVDFYILKNTDPSSRFNIACRLVEKAFARQHHVYINVNDQQEATQLDQLLWTFHDISFIPHRLYNDNNYDDAITIDIGFNVAPKHNDILINLSPTVPEYFKQFKRIMEIVPSASPWREQSREHFRFYRDQGCELKTHEI